MSLELPPFPILVDDIEELRPFPAAARQVMEVCERDDVDARQVAEIISHAPTLSLKILRVANSPLYGFSGEIRSVDHAAVVLGLRKVKELAVSSAVGEVFGGGHTGTSRIRNKLWRHSLACGCFARVLSKLEGSVAPDEAFMAGLVHDVGKLVLFDHQPMEYATVIGHGLQSNVEKEIQKFGLDHAEIGRRCGENWGLPFEIHEAICFHHRPADAIDCEPLARVVSAANLLTRIWLTEKLNNDQDLGPVMEALNADVNPDDIADARESSIEELDAAINAFS
ncbi:MAG: HDOD domain-containing protein [Planctomycetaceae bacterium]